MANGFRSRRQAEEYTFVNGQAVRTEELSHGSGAETMTPGQEGNASVPGAPAADAARSRGFGRNRGSRADGAPQARSGARQAVRDMAQGDAFELRDEARATGALMGGESLIADDRRKMRRLYIIFGIVLVVCAAISCCFDSVHLAFRSPVEVAQGIGTWVSLQFTGLFHPVDYADARMAALTNAPEFEAVAYQFGQTLKYGLCGVMLAVSGMLYQNAFRNPIAAPSMLGVTNGINSAVLVLVLQFGWEAFQHVGLYYLYSYIGGILVLLLVMLGGKWTGGKGRKFNVVNMILVGTIFSQLLGVIITYVQNNFLSDEAWDAYSELVQAVGITSTWTYVSLIVGTLAAFIPIFMFRFRLNLVSFSDEEATFLGVDPGKLRLLALGCGSMMILTAQVNAGQVAMISLVVPFVVRALFGSEFRKQLGGNIMVGSSILIVCGLLSNIVVVGGMTAGLGPVTTLVALPLFVWMLAIRQRSWD